ncbi:glycosyltransferase family 4 protein [Kaistella polysaccharea]|uniref:glycosyltransferase family 4 protein n=1 Tax=Kaistella polysaccharea TaxID=2878534 RepID=UPI001CF2D45C|nr:glycosyltransferase family 4 protein [Kaistella polysaccharea]
MKIIIPLVGTFGKAGGWRVISELANHWIAQGHEVVFFSHIKSEGPYFPTRAKIFYFDNQGKMFNDFNNNHPKALLGPFGIRRMLRNILNKQEADIVLATHCLTAHPVRYSTIKAKKFYYVQAYEPEYYYKKDIKSRVYKQISKNSYHLGLNIIVNAPMYLDYKDIKADKFVFPGVDFNVFKPTKQLQQKKIIIGTIGRLEAYKGTSYVLEAFKLLRKEMGDKLELHIAFGDDSLKSEDGIVLHIPQGDQELAEYYNSLTMYVCAGLVQLEAVHYPVIESMACKVPVITTGYLPANDDNSWKVPVKNANEIKNRVLEVLENEKETIRKIEQAFLDVQQFESKAVAAKMLNYFKE